MKKKLFKKALCVFLIVGTMITMLFGCGNGGTEDGSYDGTAEDNNSTAEDLVDVTVNEYLEPDENGVVKLYKGLYEDYVGAVDSSLSSSSRGHHRFGQWGKSYDVDDDGPGYNLNDCVCFIYKPEDIPIMKVDKDNIIAIYDDGYVSKTIDLFAINMEPRYTIPLFFDRYEKEKTDEVVYDDPWCFIEYTDTQEPMVDLGELGSYSCPVSECNGQDFSTFMNDNSINFYHVDEYGLGGDWILYVGNLAVLTADKNEEIEIGGYEGTQWISKNLTANIEFYTPRVDDAIELPLEKTKNGYFTIDCSDLSGIYYIHEVECFIEIV